MKILIIESNTILQRGLNELLQDNWSNITITYEQDWPAKNVLCSLAFDLIIIEPVIEGETYMTAVKQLLMKYSGVKVLIYTSLPDILHAVPFLRVGVSGFLNKQATEAELVTAISCILAGGRYASDHIKAILFNRVTTNGSDSNQLSFREAEVANFLIKGFMIKDIGEMMQISVGAASTYKLRVLKKFKIQNVIQLAEIMKAVKI